MPGSTCFIQEQSSNAADERQQLANDLTHYLGSGQHDPEHIRQVLSMALNSAADTAHREAMVAGQEPDKTYYFKDDVQFFASNNFKLSKKDAKTKKATFTFSTGTTKWDSNGNRWCHQSNQWIPETAAAKAKCCADESKTCQPAPPSIDESAQCSMDVRRLQREQQSMQNVIVLIQQDLQRIAEDLSQLHVESRIGEFQNPHMPEQSTRHNQPRPFAQSTSRIARQPMPKTENHQWRSISNPHAIDRYSDQRLSTASMAHHQMQHGQAQMMEEWKRMQRQVESLTQQLHHAKMQNAHVQRAGFQQPVRLQPRSNTPMPLSPATAPQIATTYYVGDLMAPPFAGATLKLMQFIKTNVAPESWTDSRMLQITEPSISLSITQTRENHEQISELLRQIRIGTRSYDTGTSRR